MNILDRFLNFILLLVDSVLTKGKVILFALLSPVVVFSITIGAVTLDAKINPWVLDMEWQWFNILSDMQHYLTYSYFNNGAYWVVFSVILSVLLFMYLYVKYEY